MQTSSALYRGLLFSLLAITVGCASYPEARYSKTAPTVDTDKKVLLAFSLQGALVTISPKPDPAKAETQKDNQAERQLFTLGLKEEKTITTIDQLQGTQALATQADAADSLYFLEPHDTFLTKSNISVTYFDSSHRIKSIGTEFQDDRIKVIQSAGGMIAALIPFLGLAPPPEKAPVGLQLPLVFDFTSPAKFRPPELPSRDQDSKWSNIPNHKIWWYRYKISQPQGRILSTEKFFENRKGFTREYPVSACVDLALQITNSQSNPDESENARKTSAGAKPEKIMTYLLRIPDPSYVELLPFPLKGSIVTHTVCGADISTQPSQSASTFEILEAVAKQVQAIYQAQQAKTKTGN